MTLTGKRPPNRDPDLQRTELVQAGARHQSLDGARHQILDGARHQSLDGARHQSLDVARHQSLDGARHQSLDGARHQSLDGARHQSCQFVWYNKYADVEERKKERKKERKTEKRWRPTCRANEPGHCMLVFPAQSPLRVYQGDR